MGLMIQTSDLMGKRILNTAEVDLIFTLSRGPSRTLNWDNFRSKAIPRLAEAAFGNSGAVNRKKVIQAICANPPPKPQKQRPQYADRPSLSDTRRHRPRFSWEIDYGRGVQGPPKSKKPKQKKPKSQEQGENEGK